VLTRLRTFVRSLRTPKEIHWSDDCPLAELPEDELGYDDNLARLRYYYDTHSTVEEMRLKES
jgi:hypothetical protein